MDLHPQHQPQGIHQQVPLASVEPLAAVVTADPAHAGRLDRLTVHDAAARPGIPSLANPFPFAQRRVEPFPGAVEAPGPEVVVDRLPGRELPRQEPPLAAGAYDIE